MRYVILHYHILKNAGATVEEILHNSFRGKFLRFDTPDRNASVPSSDLLPLLETNPHLKAVSSHQIRHPVPVAPGFIFLDMCFLRDPLDRVRSMYDYFRDKPVAGDPVSELANQFPLGEFIARLVDQIPWYVTDIQVNLLANGIANDPPERRDFAGLERMFETSFLGVVDHFNESVAAGQYFLNPLFPELDCAHPPVNVSNRTGSTLESRNQELRNACDSRVYAKLLSLNTLDIELVEQARKEVRRRFEKVPNQKAWLKKVGDRDGNSEWIAGRAAPARTPAPPPAVPKPTPGFMTKLERLVHVRRYIDVLSLGRSKLFDADYYRTSYPDVTGNPLAHFIVAGAFEGRNPHPLFDTDFYLRKYPDVAEAKVNPLGHFLKHGAAEGRQPHPLFDASYYMARYADVRQTGINPLVHYVRHGALENRRPHPWFVPEYYMMRCPDARRSGVNPLIHFLNSDPQSCCSPHPLFDCESYLQQKSEGASQGINPLVHWLLNGGAIPCGEYGEDLPSLRLNVEDIEVMMVLFDRQPPDAPLGNIVPVWRDSSGKTEFIAPPQQYPFFRSLSYDQLYAQVHQKTEKPCLTRAENS